MFKYAILLSLIGLPVQAITPTISPDPDMSGEEICELVNREVNDALALGLISSRKAEQIKTMCIVEYLNR